MTERNLNLIDGGFQKSVLFQHLPAFDLIHYQGHPDGKIQLYKTMREQRPCTIRAITLIRSQEDFLWQAAEDLLTRCLNQAATRMQGTFIFDLLTFDLHREADRFNEEEFAAVVKNCSQKMKIGEERLIRYSSVYGLLQRLAVQPWGRVTLKSAVEVYKEDPSHFCFQIERLLKVIPSTAEPMVLFLNDLSTQPICDQTNKTQQDLIAKTINRLANNYVQCLPVIYLQDKNGLRKLMSGSSILSYSK